MSKILICVLCQNRKLQTQFALETLKASKAPEDELVAFNDGSTHYDSTWLEQWADKVVSTFESKGIEWHRKEQLWWFRKTDHSHLYFTDNDTIHDPAWRENALRIQSEKGNPPLCLYNTEAHVRLPGNTLTDNPESDVIWRRYAPGVSYLLTREHVEKLDLSRILCFDWNIPDQLGNLFAVTRTSWLDHIGAGGYHHDGSAGFDGGDRCLNPTPFLIQKRAEVVKALESQ